ncbi:hypothetical protein PGTUg99_030270 [Puccinia graminis f. sp. tritici]|uniref:Uncharacterized protein n=1 Tax=Puccinia graminis f. sp. tritici TaxID=56615 RepID=A0A5B0PG78_PUCGR|nr:hypothetical protein PGTUg99_030270 [Puccinia graminis f. sp. tritici]
MLVDTKLLALSFALAAHCSASVSQPQPAMRDGAVKNSSDVGANGAVPTNAILITPTKNSSGIPSPGPNGSTNPAPGSGLSSDPSSVSPPGSGAPVPGDMSSGKCLCPAPSTRGSASASPGSAASSATATGPQLAGNGTPSTPASNSSSEAAPASGASSNPPTTSPTHQADGAPPTTNASSTTTPPPDHQPSPEGNLTQSIASPSLPNSFPLVGLLTAAAVAFAF